MPVDALDEDLDGSAAGQADRSGVVIAHGVAFEHGSAALQGRLCQVVHDPFTSRPQEPRPALPAVLVTADVP